MSASNTVAILGAGRIARVHVQMLRMHHPDVRIKYIIDPYLNDEIIAWAKGMRIERVESTPDAMFADGEVDSILICSPTPTHSDYIIRGCETGKNIYCEKPLDSSIERIHRAIEAVERTHTKFLMGFMRRFDVNQRRLNERIRAGEIGTPQIVKLCSRDPALPTYKYIESSGGIYFDSMIHDFDLARYHSGSEIREVYALGAALVDPKVRELGDVDTALVSLTFESGAIGAIDLSRQSNCGYDQRVEVHGSKGCVQMQNVAESTIVLNNEAGVHAEKPVYFFLERYANAFASAQDTFFRVVNEGLEPPVTIYDGLQAVRIAKAAQMSLDEHRPVKMDEIP